MTCLQIRIAQRQNQPEVQDNDSAKESQLQEPIPETSARESFATLEELNSGKLPPEEILSLPKFKVLYSKIVTYSVQVLQLILKVINDVILSLNNYKGQ